METRNLLFYEDPGHGWLEVLRDDLDRLGIAGKISGFSYIDAKSAYLEEDCDAGIFLNAAKAAGWEVSFKKIYRENLFVRKKSHYQWA